jgi:hypothetical protein
MARAQDALERPDLPGKKSLLPVVFISKAAHFAAVTTGGLTMKTRKTFIAAAIVAVMGCSAAHAQVLGGGNIGGALNGTLGGGLHDTSVLTNGSASGSFGGQLDSGSTLDSTTGRARGVADQTTRRARTAGANVRNRTESTVTSARDTSANVASSTAAAVETAKSEQVDSKKDLAPKLDDVSSDASGSASGNASASRDGVVAGAAADATGVASMDAKKQQDETPAPASQPAPHRERDTSKQ